MPRIGMPRIVALNHSLQRLCCSPGNWAPCARMGAINSAEVISGAPRDELPLSLVDFDEENGPCASVASSRRSVTHFLTGCFISRSVSKVHRSCGGTSEHLHCSPRCRAIIVVVAGRSCTKNVRGSRASVEGSRQAVPGFPCCLPKLRASGIARHLQAAASARCAFRGDLEGTQARRVIEDAARSC